MEIIKGVHLHFIQSEKFKTKEKKQINAMNPEIEKQNQENNKPNINTA